MKAFLYISILFLMVNCTSEKSGELKTGLGTGEFEGFTLTNYPQGGIQKAVKVDKTGAIILEGDVVDGKREGAWISYQGGTKKDSPMGIINYHKGIKNGLSVIFDNIGRFTLKEYYSNGHLEGRRVKQKFGKAIEESHYKNGILDGPFNTYYDTGSLKIKGFYENGKKEGNMIYYNLNGDVIMAYKYKNGEIVEKKNFKEE